MNPGGRNTYFLLFALSGFSGLIYESIWTHYLKLFLGHSAYAQTLVLAIFMGGMTIGSWICSRYSLRWENLLLGYAITEGITGFLALVFHDAFTGALDLAYLSIMPLLEGPLSVSVFKWSVSALLILPQSVLLGMTFPLMSAGILRLFPDRHGATIARLYFSNSIGAAIGVLVSGFLLIRWAGLPGTIRIAGIINIAIALVVWNLARDFKREKGNILHGLGATSGSPNSHMYLFFLLASMVTGVASFIYEIGWIRMLSLVLGSSTHAFELMLSAFIFGLALGGMWIQKRIDYGIRPVLYLSYVQVLMGLMALSTLILYGNTFSVMQWVLTFLSKTETGYVYFNLFSNVIAWGIMLPATFCAGMTLPLITFILIRGGHGERSIGGVYAANTVGAIIGVVFAINVGMPLLGLKGLIIFGASLDIALGLILFWRVAAETCNYKKPVLIAAIGGLAVLGTVLFVTLDPYKMASGVYRYGHILSRGLFKVIYHRDGKTATVSLTQDADGVLAIRTNGKSDSGIMMDPLKEPFGDESTMILGAVLPMTFNPRVREAAIIGLGTGLTSHTMLCNPFLNEVDTVEIEEKILEAANRFRPNVERVFTDRRSKIYIDDAKTFFSTYNKKYDIIVSEPSNPWVSGVAGLFSGEFYRLIRNNLNDEGLFVQWIQLYEIDVDLVVSVLKAISDNFSDYAIYSSNDSDLLIVASKVGRLPKMNPGVLKIPEIAEALKRIHVEGVQDIDIRKAGTKRSLSRFIESFPIQANSDYNPVLDQNAARARFMGRSAFGLLEISLFPLPVLEMLEGKAFQTEKTEISFSPYLKKSQVGSMSMALRNYYHGGVLPPRYGVLPEDIRQKAMILEKAFYECDPNIGQFERMESLLDVSILITAYLSPSEIMDFARKFESGKCASRYTTREKQWMNLFKAIGRRDAFHMTREAKALLESGRDLPVGAIRYLVATGMLGSIVQGDKEGALRLWTAYEASMFGSSPPDMVFRLLLAESAVN